ncbi:1-aminocyclopropane-1-carboxylate deaminase/D-cysteine desulfhydrase [Catalinimonas niigatensis]|uniref:1-aminocyclopropane-1-carboxylate deaminase/D-cysteine desulfhydrase n=1 Tax=Catalinimonas niigatensis TaxID=1397264 RepID=UPI002665A515|nr:pyridoxal-phosphate dependent enzyme [Catalinimonas niigatensis]WPP48229.1 pyridoxal-phosphate dependent enzyme [Catalinimonas niigatensis]
MLLHDIPDIGLQNINMPLLREHKVQLDILRVDKVHSEISGNKWFKLKYNLLEAGTQGYATLLTFGGAFSNHLYATAAAGKLHGFKTIGIVRGEKTLPLNSTLTYAEAQGMRLEFINRDAYRRRGEAEFQQRLVAQFGPCYILPEGGSNRLAVKGCTEIVQKPENYDYISCSIGTGGTVAGILEKTLNKNQLLGFSALKGGNFLYDEINTLTRAYSGNHYTNYRIVEDYHFGGYAKANTELVNFINQFKQLHQIQLDPVYTGKMMYGLLDMVEKGYFSTGSSILAIHSGGLQGITGFNERFQKKNLRILVD